MNQLYKVEIFDRSIVFKGMALVEQPTISFDYLTLEQSQFLAVDAPAEKGDFIHVTNIYGRVLYQGIVSDVTIDDRRTMVKAAPLVSLLDIDITYDRTLLQSGSLEDFIAKNILDAYASNADTLQNITGISATATSSTTGTALNIKSNVHKFWDIITKALTMYGIVVIAVMNPADRTIHFSVGVPAGAVVTIESDLDNCLEKSFVIGDSYGALNKAVYINKYDEAQRITYYLHASGDVSTSNSNRVTPVFFSIEYVESEEGNPQAFLDEAYNRAMEVLTPAQYDNEIELVYSVDDKLLEINDMKTGMLAEIFRGKTGYRTILTGYEQRANTVRLIFGVVRTELTKKLLLERRAIND